MVNFIQVIFLYILRLSDFIFPIFYLFIFAFFLFRWREFLCEIRKSSVCRMLLIYCILVFLLRFVLFKVGYPFQGRYFHPLTILSVLPVAVGLHDIVKFIEERKKIKIMHFAIIAIIFLCAAKILMPPKKKEWLKGLPEAILRNSPNDGRKNILISSIDDSRIPYYSKSEFHFFIKNNDQLGEITERYLHIRKTIDGKDKLVPENFGRGYKALINAVGEFGGDNVFILLDSRAQNIESDLKNLDLKANFRLISEFKTHTGKELSLFQGINVKNEE